MAEGKPGHASGFAERAEGRRILGREARGEKLALIFGRLRDAVKIKIASEEGRERVEVRRNKTPDHGWAGMGCVSPLAKRVW